jgi:hypothetical protein
MDASNENTPGACRYSARSRGISRLRSNRGLDHRGPRRDLAQQAIDLGERRGGVCCAEDSLLLPDDRQTAALSGQAQRIYNLAAAGSGLSAQSRPGRRRVTSGGIRLPFQAHTPRVPLASLRYPSLRLRVDTTSISYRCGDRRQDAKNRTRVSIPRCSVVAMVRAASRHLTPRAFLSGVLNCRGDGACCLKARLGSVSAQYGQLEHYLCRSFRTPG